MLMTPPPAARAPPQRCWGGKASLLRAALTQAAQAEAERVQLDEAFGVALVVGAGVFLEGDVLHRIERLWGLAADHRGVALVELEPHRAAHILLALVDQRLQHLAL